MRAGNYSWSKNSYRFKLFIIAALLAFCGQLMVSLITTINVRDSSLTLQSDSNQQLFRQYGLSVTSYFKEINSLANYLRGNEITNFSRYYWDLRNPDKAKQSRSELDQLIERLNLTEVQVEAIHILGNNMNQATMAKSIDGKNFPISENLAVDNFEAMGIMGSLTRGDGFPVYYGQGEWSGILEKLRPDKLRYAEDSGAESFLLALEERIVITSYTEGVMVLIVLQPDIFSHLLSATQPDSEGIMIVDNRGSLVWPHRTSPSMSLPELSSIVQSLEGEGTLEVNGYDLRYQTLAPYGFVSLQYLPGQAWSQELRSFMIRMAALSVSALVVSLITAWWITGRICGPLSGLALLLERKGQSLPIRPIPSHLPQRTFLRTIPLRKKLYLLYLLSVIAPVLVVGILSSGMTYSFTKHLLYESMDEWTTRLVHEINRKQSSYETLTSRLTANGEITEFVKDQQLLSEEDKKTLESMFIQQTEGIGDIAYFVLRGNTGSALYASIYPNNLELFTMSNVDLESKFREADGDTIWLEGQRDVFNQYNLTIMKRLVQPGNSRVGQERHIGYMQIVLKLTALYPTAQKVESEYSIVNIGGQFVAGSSYDETSLEAANKAVVSGSSLLAEARIPFETSMDGRNYLLATRYVPDKQWTVVTYQPTLEIVQKSRSLLERNLGITLLASLVVLVITLVVSRLLVRPIEQLIAEMERVGTGAMDSTIEYSGSDEIGELFRSFNTMTRKINELLKENVDSKVREYELDRLKTQAELGMLQQQINPHFLYNTLEAVNMRSLQHGAEDVSKMVTALARLFRYVISAATDVVKLSQELEHTSNYVTIQELRFKNKFIVNWSIDPETKDSLILKLVLQPLVENAINHGLAEYVTGGVVDISTRISGDFVVIEVCDNGIGMEEEELKSILTHLREPLSASGSIPEKGGTAVGLRNVYWRLIFHYGELADMTITSIPMERTCVQIRFPR